MYDALEILSSSSTVMADNIKQQLANLVNSGGAPKDLTEKYES